MLRRLIASLLLTGLTVVPVAHQLDHARPHTHGADALVFDASDQPTERGPHGGLLLHPKSAAPTKHSHQEPLSHGRGSVEHYGVAVALSSPPAPPPQPVAVVAARSSPPLDAVVDTYLLSPLQPGAPPA